MTLCEPCLRGDHRHHMPLFESRSQHFAEECPCSGECVQLLGPRGDILDPKPWVDVDEHVVSGTLDELEDPDVMAGPAKPRDEREIKLKMMYAITRADDLLRKLYQHCDGWHDDIREVRGLLAEWRLETDD